MGSLCRKLIENPQAQSSSRVDNSCHTISLDNKNTTDGLDTLTIDFGEGCLYYGRYRKGKVIFTYTGRYREVNTVITTSFENYDVDGIKIEGNRTTTNNGVIDGKLNFSINVTNGKFTFTDSSMTRWTSSRTRVIDLNQTERNFTDDIISIHGSASSTHESGTRTEHIITEEEPLVYNTTCRVEGGLTSRYLWMPVSGEKETTVYQDTTTIIRLFEYGEGECDNSYTVTVNGISYPFTF